MAYNNNGYSDMYNESINTIDLALISDIEITNSITIDPNVIINGLVDNITTDFNLAKLLEVKLGGVKTPQLGNLTSITFQQAAGNTTNVKNINPFVNTIISIPDPGVSATNFIIADKLSQQVINSDLNLNGSNELGGLSANSVLSLNSSKNIIASNLTNGQLLIGNTSNAPNVGTITSIGGSLAITYNNPNINIETSASDTFNHINLIDTANQIIIQAGNGSNFKYSLNATNPTANRIYTFNDVFADTYFIMAAGAQNITGTKTFVDTIHRNITCQNIAVLATANDNYIVKFSSGGGTCVVLQSPTAANLVFGFPDPTTTGGGVNPLICTTEGTNTMNGNQVLGATAQLFLTRASNQLIIQQNTFQVIMNWAATTANLTYGIPNTGSNCNFIMGAGPFQTIKTITNQFFTIAGDSSSGTQLVINNAAITKTLTLGYDTTNDGAKIEAFNNVSYATSSIAIGSLGEIVQVGGFFAGPVSRNVGQFLVYGSAITDAADVFKIRQNTNTNPYEIYMGMNTAGPYGVIQSTQQGVSYVDTFISPNGGNVRVGGGIKFPNPSTSSVTLLSDYGEENTAYVWQGPWIVGNNPTFALQFTRIGRTVTIIIPSIQAVGNSTVSAITNTVAFPVRFRPPFTINYAISIFNGAASATGSMQLTTAGILGFYKDGAFTGFSFTGTVGSNATSITYSV